MRKTTKKYKNDLEKWHLFAELAEEFREVFKYNEIQLIKLCKDYSYDNEACEEYCNNEGPKRTKDFNSQEECWKCPNYQEGKVKKR